MERMKSGTAGVVSALIVGLLVLAGCSQTPPGQNFASGSKSTEEDLHIVEVVARPAGAQPDALARPSFPTDVVEIAIKTQGQTSGANLSVKMISLANGAAVGTRSLQLNASNAAAPSLRFEPAPEWAAGRYLFEVSLDGKLAGSQELEIFPAELAEPSKS